MKVHELITYLSTLPVDTEIHTVRFYRPEYWGTTPLSLYNLKIVTKINERYLCYSLIEQN